MNNKTHTIKDGSVALENVNYNGNDAVLTIEFTTGGKYDYYNVPRSVAAKITSAESMGKAFHQHIRGRYEFEQIA